MQINIFISIHEHLRNIKKKMNTNQLCEYQQNHSRNHVSDDLLIKQHDNRTLSRLQFGDKFGSLG